MAALKAEYFSEFEKLGEDHVRLKVDKGQFSGTRLTWAIEWLAAKVQDSRRKNEASSTEQIRITRSAKNAAWAAAIAAIAAAIVAVIAAVILYRTS